MKNKYLLQSYKFCYIAGVANSNTEFVLKSFIQLPIFYLQYKLCYTNKNIIKKVGVGSGFVKADPNQDGLKKVDR